MAENRCLFLIGEHLHWQKAIAGKISVAIFANNLSERFCFIFWKQIYGFTSIIGISYNKLDLLHEIPHFFPNWWQQQCFVDSEHLMKLYWFFIAYSLQAMRQTLFSSLNYNIIFWNCFPPQTFPLFKHGQMPINYLSLRFPFTSNWVLNWHPF